MLHLVTDRDRRGAQVHATDLAQGLAALGVEGPVVALAPGEHDDELPVDALGPSRRSLTTLRAVRRLARRHDVVVAHGSTTLFVASVALAGTGVPFVYRQISDPLHWAAGPWRRARVALMIRRAARVVALSDGAAEVLRCHYALDAQRIRVIPNAVPGAGFSVPDEDAVRRARRSLGLDVEGTLLVYVGALVEEKGVDLAIRSVASDAGCRLLVVGSGDRRDDLETLAQQVAPGRVHFVGPTDRPVTALQAADLFVFPSLGGDSMPAALIEAGLCGLASVTTPVGSIPDVVVDGETGRVVPIGDQAALDAAVGELASDPAGRERLGRAARRRCLDRFTIEATAPRWLELLTEVAGARSGRDRPSGPRPRRS